MAQQQQAKTNPIFGPNFMQNFMPDEWDDVVDEFPEDVQKINLQSAQEASGELTRNGPVSAIHVVVAKIDALAANGDISQFAADAAKVALYKLRDIVREKRKKDATEKKQTIKAQISKSQNVQWTLPPAVSPVVSSWDELWSNMPASVRKHRRAQLNALTPDQRAEIEVRLAKGITKRELGNLITRMAEE